LKRGAVDMPELASVLSNRLNRVVRDRTDLAGRFDLDLTLEGLPIPLALEEQLGLTLRASTGRVGVLVIDSVTQPG
jgi:uncharacterized protein (TIGR03435 family)